MNDSERDQLLIRVDTNVGRLMTDVQSLERRIVVLEVAAQTQRGAVRAATLICSAIWAALTAAFAIFWNK